MSYRPTKCKVNLWTSKVTVAVAFIWLRSLGILRPEVLLATGSSVQIGLNLKRVWAHIILTDTSSAGLHFGAWGWLHIILTDATSAGLLIGTWGWSPLRLSTVTNSGSRVKLVLEKHGDDEKSKVRLNFITKSNNYLTRQQHRFIHKKLINGTINI